MNNNNTKLLLSDGYIIFYYKSKTEVYPLRNF